MHPLSFSCREPAAPERVPTFTKRTFLMVTGTVKFFNNDKGYGFIAPEGGGADAFVHITALESAGLSTLTENQKVSYDVEPDKRGKMAAVNIQAL
jgi:CspA family cold shock protein